MNNTEVANEVYRLLNEHGLVEKGWTFKLSNTKRIMGQCRYRTKEIRVSGVHIALGEDADIMDTIRHEVAHAITGPGHKHDHVWKLNAIRLGARPKATAKLGYSLPHKYEIRCGVCETTLQKRHRRKSRKVLARAYCKKCGMAASQGQLYLVHVVGQHSI